MRTQSRSLRQIISDTLWRRSGFARDERGATAVEFALLALPFFALLGAILETAIVFLASQILDSAVNDSSRLIRTGQAHQNDYTEETYRGAICDSLYGMFDCDQLKIKVTEISDFTTAATTADIVDEDTGDWELVESYDHGDGSSIVLVEAYYKWPTYLDFFGFNLASTADNTRLLAGVRVFRNEPFS